MYKEFLVSFPAEAISMAPVMTINDDVYGRLTPDQIDGILDKYLDA